MNEFEIFIDHWYHITVIWSQIALSVGVFILIFYMLALTAQKTLTKKHEFINAHEIKSLWYAGLSMTISFTLFINAIIVHRHDTETDFILLMKTFVSLMLGFAIGYFISSYLHVYYPFRLAKRLHKLRFTPRYNPSTGHEMRMLTESEEDVHLTEEMIHHENISAYEYDVWIDDETGFKIIEKYEGDLTLMICDECNFRTAKEYKEEVEKEPTGTKPGVLLRYYRCSFCEHVQKKESTIAPLASN